MCLVPNCDDDHNKHYCRVCDNKNSDHFARKCPFGRIVYHGTTQEAAEIIQDQGFKASKKGRLGKGVYFTDNQHIARQISQDRARKRSESPQVIKCIVPINTPHSMHPKWKGVTNGSFKQLLVKNSNRIKILSNDSDQDSDSDSDS